MDKITMMRIRELNSRILNEEGRLQNARNNLNELKEQLIKVKENK